MCVNQIGGKMDKNQFQDNAEKQQWEGTSLARFWSTRASSFSAVSMRLAVHFVLFNFIYYLH